MDGMKKSYSYIALAQGVVGMRTFACWCDVCMKAIGRGEGSLDSNLRCAGCASPHLLWAERSCARTDAAGVANAKLRAQTYARGLSDQLKRRLETGRVLVAVQNRGEDDGDQYWLGWATRVVKTHSETGTVPGTRVRYDQGDLEIAIEPWLTRDVSGGEERRIFRKWVATPADMEAGCAADPGPTTGKVYTVNSTELRSVDITLEQVRLVGGVPLGVVARERRHAAVAGDVRRRNALPGVAQAMKAVHEVVAALPRELWELSVADENLILANCW